MTVEHVFRVRWYQQAFHRALVERTHDRLMAVWHRRAGKDEIALNACRELAFRQPGNYWHCFPEYKQARKAIWNGVNARTGKRRIDEAFPPQIRKRMQDDDMFIEFVNGSTWQLLGSDRYDATVGAGPKGIIYSEWALCNPAAWAYHSPMIREAGGFAAFITTPRGNNHAKTMFDRALVNDKWFCERLSVGDTGALSQDVLDEALREYQDLYGEELGRALFEQEYHCSFSGAMIGAYFGAEMARAEREQRLMPVPINPKYPVHTAWDLGKAENNPIWCFQVIPGEPGPRIVDFYKPAEDDVELWCKWLDDRGYHGTDFVPHDAVTGLQWGSRRSRIEILKALGRKPKLVLRASLADSLQAARKTINLSVFHLADDERGERMQQGIDGLRSYRREWDEDRQVFRELKDWAEHIASAFRYLGLAWRGAVEEVEEKPKAKDVEFRAGPYGTIVSNMGVKEAVEAMVRRRKREG